MFPEAFGLWMAHMTIQTNGLRSNVRYIAPKTERDYRVCASALERFFGTLRLDQIELGHLASYQQLRATNPPDPHGSWRCRRGKVVRGEFDSFDDAETWARHRGAGCDIVQTTWAYPAGANCIRKEVALLVRILRDARLWGEDQDRLLMKVQAVDPDIERAMSVEEQHRFLHVAASEHRHLFMYQYAIVALQTTADTNELRHLRLGDIFLADGFIQIRRASSKNPYRMRTIPLVTDDARWAMEGLMARARELGAWSPSHYLFPLQTSRTHYDPNSPMSESGLKKPWDAVRKAASLPKLRLYDLRHTGITRMAENGVPLEVAMSFAGHMTEAMQRHYTAICMAAKRRWGAAVWGEAARPDPAETAQITSQVASAFGPPRKPVAAVSLPGVPNKKHG